MVFTPSRRRRAPSLGRGSRLACVVLPGEAGSAAGPCPGNLCSRAAVDMLHYVTSCRRPSRIKFTFTGSVALCSGYSLSTHLGLMDIGGYCLSEASNTSLFISAFTFDTKEKFTLFPIYMMGLISCLLSLFFMSTCSHLIISLASDQIPFVLLMKMVHAI